MAKAFWRGAISFGMVSIPVRMSLATETKTPSFNLLHKKCLTRPKQVLYCKKDNEYFSVKDTVRGYEYAKGQYIVFSESDFESVPTKTLHTIAILGFVESKDIDPIYYYDSHYLEPEELGIKPFCLLRTTLAKTGRLGIAKVAFQRREHLCTLRPLDEIMVLHTMHYHDEILPRHELAPPKTELKSEEVEMATALVNAMSKKFKPDDYQDEYALVLQKLIEAKVEGQEIEAPPEVPEVKFEDLMSALRASIEEAQKAAALTR